MAKSNKNSKVAPTSKESKYLESIDFMSWWESFRFDTAKNGHRKYKTVWQFIIAKTKVGWQRDLLYWVLGPKVEDNPASPYSKFEQYDWESKFQKGVWSSSDNLDMLQQNIRSQGHAMAKLAELGSVNVDFVARLKAILKTLDEEFAGRLFLPELSSKRNRERIELFMMLNRQILEMMQQAQLMYGKMQGVDLQQLTQFIGMFGKGMGQAAGMGQMLGISSEQNTVDPRKGTFDKLVDMVLTKSATYEMPLPDKDLEEILVDTRTPKLVKK